MLSERALSKVTHNKRKQTAPRHSQLIIPSQQQACEREQKLKYFHIRSLHFRRKSLQNVCKENYRIYINLNEQQSSYKQLFADRHHHKSKSKDRPIIFRLKQAIQKQHAAYFQNELTKLTRMKQIIGHSRQQDKGTPVSKRQGIRQILTERAKNIDPSPKRLCLNQDNTNL